MLIRTIHHLSASGGTVISKCLASLPNVYLLSEVHPREAGEVRFNPVDPLQQFQAQYGLLSPAELEGAFLDRLARIVSRVETEHGALVLRDHSHSDFLWQRSTFQPTLLALLRTVYETVSIVTVRHPLDCYLAARSSNWHNGLSLDRYCAVYRQFLDVYDGLPTIRYEEVVQSPRPTVRKMAELLHLDYADDFVSRFGTMRLTGDSGRTGASLGTRPRRPYERKLNIEMESSEDYRQLCERLGYEG